MYIQVMPVLIGGIDLILGIIGIILIVIMDGIIMAIALTGIQVIIGILHLVGMGDIMATVITALIGGMAPTIIIIMAIEIIIMDTTETEILPIMLADGDQSQIQVQIIQLAERQLL